MENWKQQLIDLSATRSAALDRADKALADNRVADYDSAMTEVGNVNKEIERVNNLLKEQTRRAVENVPTGSEAEDIANERGAALLRGKPVTFNTVEQLRMMRNAVTVATSGLTQPIGSGTEVNTPVGYDASYFIDMVRVEDCTGLNGWEEPYMISGLDAKSGKITTLAGTKRTASTDPSFGVAAIKPYEVNITAYVDRNISRITPARYYERILRDATIAYRRKVNDLIVNGDGQSSPDMFGILNATNKAGARISKDVTITTLDEEFIDNLFFEYGSDDEFGIGARLAIAKADLKKLGKIRNTNKERIFKMRYEAGNPNTGMLDDSGSMTPFVLTSALNNKVIYGDPTNYMLGLFGDFTVRIDESYMASERMLTILGDAFVGGNVIRHNGFVIGALPTAPAASGSAG